MTSRPSLSDMKGEMTHKASPDILGLETSVNDSSKSISLLWISFILFGSYLMVSTSALTPSALFLGAGIQIPIVAISVGLEVYSIVGSLLVCLFAIYVYVQIDGFAQKAKLYDTALESEYPTRSAREKKRGSLDLFPLLQLIAGANKRLGYSILLLAIIWISLFLIPVTLLITLLVKTLPYHSEPVTWSIRTSLVVLSAGFLTVFLRILKQLKLSRALTVFLSAPSIVIITLALVFACAVAIFPGETIYRNRLSETLVLPMGSDREPLYKVMFEGKFNLAKAARQSLFTNTLIVTPTAEFQEATSKLGAAFVRGRDFRQAAFVDLNLAKADFSGSMLSGALFYRTNLNQARFDCLSDYDPALYSNINLDRAPASWPDGCSWMHGIHFDLSTLQGASFYGARIRWVSFVHSYLQGAYFTNANMQAANIAFSDLTGANFQQARLSGAGFTWCNLSGVNFSQAWMSGVHIGGCKLNGVLMLETHARGLVLETPGLYQFVGSAIQPTISNNDIFDKKDGDDYSYWKRKIIEDKPKDTISSYWTNGDIALENLSVDSAGPLETQKSIWKTFAGFIDEEKPAGSSELAQYSDAAVTIACSSNGAPHVARSIFIYNRALPNLADSSSLFSLGNTVLPSLYEAIERFKRESRPCPGLKEILDAWPLETKLPSPNKDLDTKSPGPSMPATSGTKAKKAVTKG